MSSFKKNQDRNTVKPSRGSILGPVDIGLNNFSLVLIIPSFINLCSCYLPMFLQFGMKVQRLTGQWQSMMLNLFLKLGKRSWELMRRLS